MLNKIIKELEEAKKYQIPHIEAGIEVAISIIKQHESEFNHHPLSPEDIERAAKEYSSSAFPADITSFIAGANFAKQPIANEWVKDLLRWLKDNHFLNETEDTLNYIVNNYNPPKK